MPCWRQQQVYCVPKGGTGLSDRAFYFLVHCILCASACVCLSNHNQLSALFRVALCVWPYIGTNSQMFTSTSGMDWTLDSFGDAKIPKAQSLNLRSLQLLSGCTVREDKNQEFHKEYSQDKWLRVFASAPLTGVQYISSYRNRWIWKICFSTVSHKNDRDVLAISCVFCCMIFE